MPPELAGGPAANDNAMPPPEANEQVLAATGTDDVVAGQPPEPQVVEGGSSDGPTTEPTGGGGGGPDDELAKLMDEQARDMAAERRGESGLAPDENVVSIEDMPGEGPIPDPGEPGRIREMGSQDAPDTTRLEAGNEFNRVMAPEYPANEVVLEGGNRPDSYRPNQEIISRKRTQLAAISENQAIGYVTELAEKYPPGTPIADTPRNRGMIGVAPGEPMPPLRGRMVLEVSVQQHEIPQIVADLAKRLNIEIRDFNGQVLNP